MMRYAAETLRFELDFTLRVRRRERVGCGRMKQQQFLLETKKYHTYNLLFRNPKSSILHCATVCVCRQMRLSPGKLQTASEGFLHGACLWQARVI